MGKRAEPISHEQVQHQEGIHDTGAAEDASLTAAEREWLLDTVLASQALAGIYISREVAARLLDEVMREPLPEIG